MAKDRSKGHKGGSNQPKLSLKEKKKKKQEKKQKQKAEGEISM